MAKTLYRFSIVVVTTILSVGIAKYLSDTFGVDTYVAQFCSTLVMTSLALFFIIRDMARYRVFNISFWSKEEVEEESMVEVPISFEKNPETPKKKTMSEETRRKISEKAKIREQKKREQKARFEKTQKESAVRKAKRATAKK